jgi:hypothetical protein
MHGCQIGCKCPIVFAKSGQFYPTCFLGWSGAWPTPAHKWMLQLCSLRSVLCQAASLVRCAKHGWGVLRLAQTWNP